MIVDNFILSSGKGRTRSWICCSEGDFVEFVVLVVPLVLDDHLLVAEMVLGLAVDKVEDGVQFLAHARVGRAEGLDALLVECGALFCHARGHIEALGLEAEVELFEVGAELVSVEGHALAVLRVVVVDAEVNELLSHLVDDLPAS